VINKYYYLHIININIKYIICYRDLTDGIGVDVFGDFVICVSKWRNELARNFRFGLGILTTEDGTCINSSNLALLGSLKALSNAGVRWADNSPFNNFDNKKLVNSGPCSKIGGSGISGRKGSTSGLEIIFTL